MFTEETVEWLNLQPQMTSKQLMEAEEETRLIVLEKIGEKPTRKSVARFQKSPFSVIDIGIAIIGITAFIASSIHVWSFQSKIFAIGDVPQVAEWLWLISHQYGYILMSEAAILTFLVLFSLSSGRMPLFTGGIFKKSIYISLAFISITFGLLANFDVQAVWVETFTRAMPIFFTIGIGVYFDKHIMMMISNRYKTTQALNEALEKWHELTSDYTSHPQYDYILKQSIWEKAMAIFGFNGTETPEQKIAFVDRELSKYNWAKSPDVYLEAARVKSDGSMLELDADEDPLVVEAVDSIEVRIEGGAPIYYAQSPFPDIDKEFSSESQKRLVSSIRRHVTSERKKEGLAKTA